jgi:hypothetical protein
MRCTLTPYSAARTAVPVPELYLAASLSRISGVKRRFGGAGRLIRQN